MAVNMYYDLSSTISKFGTTLQWKVLVSNKHVNNMTERYKNTCMLGKFEEWAEDSMPLFDDSAM